MSQSLAVFIDGENVSANFAQQIDAIVAKFGQPQIKRVYGDVRRIAKWEDCCGYRLLHSGSGKNAADILLVVDAMDLVLNHEIDVVFIASSDRDFSHLATRLVELGKTVVGIGENKAPKLFRASCSRFMELCDAPKVQRVDCKNSERSSLDHKIREIIAQHSKNGLGVPISLLSQIMYTKHDVRISQSAEKNWRGYLGKRTNLYDLDPKGPSANVRVKPEGFASQASI